MSLKLLHEPETEDPILSVVNLIDIFLVIIAALLITFFAVYVAWTTMWGNRWYPKGSGAGDVSNPE